MMDDLANQSQTFDCPACHTPITLTLREMAQTTALTCPACQQAMTLDPTEIRELLARWDRIQTRLRNLGLSE